MTALDLLPRATRQQLKDPNNDLRIDLRMIEPAEDAGWKVSFRDNDWRNAADFEKPGRMIAMVKVRLAGTTELVWREFEMTRVKVTHVRSYAHTFDDLATALGLTVSAKSKAGG